MGISLWRPDLVSKGQQDVAINHPPSSVSCEGCKSALILTEGLDVCSSTQCRHVHGPGYNIEQGVSRETTGRINANSVSTSL